MYKPMQEPMYSYYPNIRGHGVTKIDSGSDADRKVGRVVETTGLETGVDLGLECCSTEFGMGGWR
jgi:hypothetical protein